MAIRSFIARNGAWRHAVAALGILALAAQAGIAAPDMGNTADKSKGDGGFLASFGWFDAPRPRYSLTIQLDPPRAALPLPPVEGVTGPGRPLVVIDPGHGGHDPGAVTPEGALREKELTLAVARAIRDELLASGRVRVAMTRNDDHYLVHRERFEIARKLGADLFVSIHADAAARPEARGATVYTLSATASDSEAALLAQRENRSDIIKGVDLGGENAGVATILIDLAQRETLEDSTDFAELLKREADPMVTFRPDYHRTASLLVLKAPDVPSILFECGYITNAEDVAFLGSAEGRKRIARGFRQAVEIHFARRLASR